MNNAGLSRLPIDKGWAWVLCFGFTMSKLVLTVTMSSTSILLVDIMEIYHVTVGTVSFIPAIQMMLSFLLVPLTNLLAQRLGTRVVMVTGGLLCAAGYITSMFATSVYMLYVTLGALTGLGTTVLIGPSPVHMSFFFEKRRAFAFGLSSIGFAVGGVASAVLVRYLVDTYGFKGALLLISGIQLQTVVIACLFRPISFYETGVVMNKSVIIEADNSLDQNENSKKMPMCIRTSPTGVAKHEEAVTGDMLLYHINEQKDEGRDTVEDTKDTPMTSLAPKEADNHGERNTQTLLRLLRKPSLMLVMGSTFCFQIGLMFPAAFGPAYCEDIDISLQDTALLLSIGALPGFFVAPLVGWFADLRLVQNVVIQAFFAGIFAAVICLWTLFDNFGLVLFLIIACNACKNGYIAVVMPILIQEAGLPSLSFVQGLQSALVGVAALISPPVFGALKDATGSWFVPAIVTGCCTSFSSITLIVLVLMNRMKSRS